MQFSTSSVYIFFQFVNFFLQFFCVLMAAYNMVWVSNCDWFNKQKGNILLSMSSTPVFFAVCSNSNLFIFEISFYSVTAFPRIIIQTNKLSFNLYVYVFFAWKMCFLCDFEYYSSTTMFIMYFARGILKTNFKAWKTWKIFLIMKFSEKCKLYGIK